MQTQFQTYEEQLKILKAKGLTIDCEQETLHTLARENYYNLINGYKTLFLACIEKGTFIPNATFNEISMLYNFDRDLRNMLINYLLRFETAIKSCLTYRFCEKYSDNHAYLAITSYASESSALKNILQLIPSLYAIIKNRREHKGDIAHHLNKYGYVPLWVLVKYMTFGNVQKMYSCLDANIRNTIAKDFALGYRRDYGGTSIITSEMMESILKIMNFYRNACAHEERIYNYKLLKPAQVSQLSKVVKVDTAHLKDGNPFTLVTSLKSVTPKENFCNLKRNLSNLFSKYGEHFQSIKFDVILRAMGFPPEWKQLI